MTPFYPVFFLSQCAKRSLCLLLSFVSLVLASRATPINAYAKVTAISGGVLTLSNINQTYHSFTVGEQVILIQMQDNVIGSNTANNSSFGTISTIGSAGLYFVYTINAFSGSTMTLNKAPMSAFNPSKPLQVVSYNNLGTNYTVNSSIMAVPWNGSVGGIVALQVTGTLTLNSSITADAAGFRGGAASATRLGSCEPATYMSGSTNYGIKGEGIHYTGYGGYTARAPLSTGGGGGSFNNAGGGGGSNFTAGGTGGGGNSCTLANQSGGIGGSTLSTYISGGRVFMGGGGGGGQQNDGVGSAGAAGGGIVFIGANKIATGCFLDQMNITAEGGTAGNSGQDGAGGAGAGGSVVLAVASYTANFWCPLNIAADGGNGGDVNNFTAYGGGGGGGQGALLFTAALPTSNISTSTDNGNGGSNSFFGSTAGDGAGSSNIGIIPSTPIVLPLDILSFAAEKEGAVDVLDWAVARTVGAARCTVQRSADGETWGDLGVVSGDASGAGSDGGSDYHFTDASPLAGRNFYRVRVTDVAGEEKYTSVLLVNRQGDVPAAFHVFPNPARGAFTVQLGDGSNGSVGIAIEDVSGATVYRTTTTAADGRINVANIGAVTPGIYLLRVTTKDGVQTGKLILQ